MISKDKTYRTRDGREVRIYATDGYDQERVHGAIKMEQGWCAWNWNRDGVCYKCERDLIEVRSRIKRTVWLNVYRFGVSGYDSKEYADYNACENRLACVKVEIDCEEGEGL